MTKVENFAAKIRNEDVVIVRSNSVTIITVKKSFDNQKYRLFAFFADAVENDNDKRFISKGITEIEHRHCFVIPSTYTGLVFLQEFTDDSSYKILFALYFTNKPSDITNQMAIESTYYSSQGITMENPTYGVYYWLDHYRNQITNYQVFDINFESFLDQSKITAEKLIDYSIIHPIQNDRPVKQYFV